MPHILPPDRVYWRRQVDRRRAKYEDGSAKFDSWLILLHLFLKSLRLATFVPVWLALAWEKGESMQFHLQSGCTEENLLVPLVIYRFNCENWLCPCAIQLKLILLSPQSASKSESTQSFFKYIYRM